MHPSTMTAPSAVMPALDLYAPISTDLEEVERILARVLKSRYAAVNSVVEHVRHYRGKRLRPVLLLLTARACGKVTPAHPILGAVVEMIHTATLVHDDILDNATTRRHVATINSRWDYQTAVLLGDYLFTHAFHLASTVPSPLAPVLRGEGLGVRGERQDTTKPSTPHPQPLSPEYRGEGGTIACQLIGAATNRVCEGEMCQGLASGNLDLTEEEYLDAIDGKTAELIACCCQLGALLQRRLDGHGPGADALRPLRRSGIPDRRRLARPGRGRA